MSKLTDIKNRIDQMDGGAFQNLCDAYLSYKGYKNVYSLGMLTGTDKTAKGNPDTYFLTTENKYVFVMYTTQKTDFLKKAIEDIDKCFDSQKTGVSAEDIVEIIYCHTYGRLYRYLDCLITAQGDHFRVYDHYDTTRLLKIWDTEQYIDLADGVFDYCYSKREELTYWLYWSPVKMMLHHEASHQETTVKQDLWMQHTIEKHGHDEDRMCLLFTAIEELSCERRRKAVEKFLSLNTNPDVFERLPLEPSHWGGTGSMIPYMQERIEYLRSLIPLVFGIKYLKQKQRIEREIDCWKERIRSEEIRELLESWYR